MLLFVSAFWDLILQVVGPLLGSGVPLGLSLTFAEGASTELCDKLTLKRPPPGKLRHRNACLASLEGEDVYLQGNKHFSFPTDRNSQQVSVSFFVEQTRFGKADRKVDFC